MATEAKKVGTEVQEALASVGVGVSGGSGARSRLLRTVASQDTESKKGFV